MSLSTRGPIIDSHHHLWRMSRGDYGWLAPELGVLYRDYEPEELAELLGDAGVAKTVLVQAAETEAETRFLLELADRHDFIAGVVGWLDFEADDFGERLDALRTHRKLVGLRPMLQGLADDAYVLRPKVLGNLERLADAGLALDVLTYPRHLRHVAAALRRVPTLRAVLDHLSKPPIASGVLDPWRGLLAEVAANPLVSCKVSGLVTEANPATWTEADLEPYVVHALETFGADRLMWGSDWPVCLLAAPYGRVLDASLAILSRHLSAADLHKVLAVNAGRFYGL